MNGDERTVADRYCEACQVFLAIAEVVADLRDYGDMEHPRRTFADDARGNAVTLAGIVADRLELILGLEPVDQYALGDREI